MAMAKSGRILYLLESSYRCRPRLLPSRSHHNMVLPPGVKVEEIEIPVPWGHVAGRWWGPRDKQPIIAVHGWQDNAGTWDNLAPLLPPSTPVLAIDLPGHGLSAHYPTGMKYYPHWDGLYLLRRIVKHFNWSKVTLMGHSLGAGVGFLYAASFPDDVEGLICIDTASPAVRKPSEMVNYTGKHIDKFLCYENIIEDQTLAYSYDEMIEIVVKAYEGIVTRENCKVLMKRGIAPAPMKPMKKNGYYFKRDPRLKVCDLAMMSIETALEYAAKVRCRVLNIRVISVQKLYTLDYYMPVIDKLKVVTDLNYIEVQGTHHVQLESPQNIVDFIKEFLE